MTQASMPNEASTIRFSRKNQADFTKTLRQRVDNYFKNAGIPKTANTAMVVKTVVLLSAYILPFVAMVIWAMPWYWALFLWTSMGISVSGIGMAVMHDANHGAYSRNPKVNKWVGHTLNLLGGAVVNWKMQHNVLHHTYTNIAGKDNDIDGAGTLRFHPHGEAKKHHKHQWIYAFGLYSILTIFWALAKDFIQFFRYKEARSRQSTPRQEAWLFARIAVSKVLYFGLFLGLPIFVGGHPAWVVITGFLLMHVIGGLILSLVFQLAHVVEDTDFPLPDAGGQMEDSFWAHQLRTTCNFSNSNALMTWYTGGLNHQVEHHLFPNICHVHYPAIAPIVKETAEEFGLPYHAYDTIGPAIRSHITMLKRFGVPSLSEIGAG